MPQIASSDDFKVLVDRVAIVLVGAFNPTIFQPEWFSRNQILRASEAEQAEIRLINPQLTQFKTTWMEIQVTRNRVVAQSINGGYEEPVVDLIVSVFTLLEHTPVQGIGMNREVQLEFAETDKWHAFGHFVAPKNAWSGVLDAPGLVSMQMQSPRPGEGNTVNVVVTNKGFKRTDVDVNEHRQLAADRATGAGAVSVLREGWKTAYEQSGDMIDRLIRQGKK